MNNSVELYWLGQMGLLVRSGNIDIQLLSINGRDAKRYSENPRPVVVPGVFLCEYIEKGNQSLKNSTDASFSVPRSHITSTDLSPNLNT